MVQTVNGNQTRAQRPAAASFRSSTSYLQIFLLMLGNNSKDGKVMWEMNVGRDKIIKKSLTKRWKLKR